MKQIKLIILAALSCALFTQAYASDSYPRISMNFAHFLPETYYGAHWEKWWAEEIEERSGGNITVQIFWAGSLGGPTEILDLVGSGAVDAGATAQGYFYSQIPFAGSAGNLMMRTHETASDAIDTWRQFQKDPQIQRELEDENVVQVAVQGSNPYKLTCTKPVRTLEDIRGLRIRVPGSYMPEWWSSLGAVPSNVPLAEQYDALRRGVIDCAFTPHDQIFATKLHEVAPYAIDLNVGSHVIWGIFINRDLFNGFPPEVQELINEVSQEMMENVIEEYEEVYVKTIEEDMPANNVTYVTFEEKDAIDGVALNTIDLWVERMTRLGFEDAAARLEPVLREKQANFKD